MGKAGGVDAVYIVARCYDKVKEATPPEVGVFSSAAAATQCAT